MTEIVLAPAASALAGVTLQMPPAATVVVRTAPPGSVTRIVSPAAPVPVKVGVVAFVTLSPTRPESEAAASPTVGVPAATAIVTVNAVGAETLPAGSVAVTETALAPAACTVVGVTLQVPPAATVVVSTGPAGSVTRIVSPAVPVPEIVGVVSLVTLSPTVPESEAGSSRATGAVGATESMLTVSEVAGDTLPAGSVAVTVIVLAPSASGVSGVTLQVLPAPTVVVRTWPPGKLTVIVSPARPVPEIVGVVSEVRLSPVAPRSEAGSSSAVGADGATVSSVNTTGDDATLGLPAASVTRPVTE